MSSMTALIHGYKASYVLDPLYRVAQTISPVVPSTDTSGARHAMKSWTTLATYDLAGHKVVEQDGNGSATRWTYHFARLLPLAERDFLLCAPFDEHARLATIT
jgi:hypothetical protein